MAISGLISNQNLPAVEQTVRHYERPPQLPEFDGVSEKREGNMGYLSLAIEGENPTLEQLVASYSRSQNNDPTNRIQVNGHSCRLIREERGFLLAPPSLSIHLKRFNFQRGAKSPLLGRICQFFSFKWCAAMPGITTKKTTPVQFPDRYTLQPIEGNRAEYELDAFIVHHGASANSGHYVSYIKEGADWFLADDAHVRLVTAEELAMAKSSAYMIHYSQLPPL
jgi:hypothetical protein